ncbi:MAG TPA: amidohydrolase family protein [bacterium]|nr:amidohydrolase family protein [bacterium]
MNEKLYFFDVNVQVGPLTVPQPWHRDQTAKGTLDLMDRFGIDEALVVHTLSREGHPSRGNQRLCEEIQGMKRLHPSWTILPPGGPEFVPPDRCIELMGDNEVSAARVVAKYAGGGVPLEIPWMGKWYEALAEKRIPLLLDMNHTSPFYNEFPWMTIDRICEAFPKLRLVLLGAGYRIQRDLYAMLAKHENLYMDIGFYCLQAGIEDLVFRFGANRFLFGSYLPHYSPGGPKFALTYADLPFEDRQKIAGGNLKRLLSEAWS